MTLQKGGLALQNFIDVPSGLSSLCIPLGLHCEPYKNKSKSNYKVTINTKTVNNNTFNNLISKAKSKPFKSSKKNRLKINKLTRKNRK